MAPKKITPATSHKFCNHPTLENAHRWYILPMHFEWVTFLS